MGRPELRPPCIRGSWRRACSIPTGAFAGEDLEGPALRLPNIVDVEYDVRLVVALLGLVRLEQEDRRGVVGKIGARLVSYGLGDDTGFLREARRLRVIDIVGSSSECVSTKDGFRSRYTSTRRSSIPGVVRSG